MEPLSCVVHGVQRVHIRLTDHVAIFGAGPIGILMPQMARIGWSAALKICMPKPTIS
jgi:threonine dehydrogenase-like Zn-dependent dehydrogenase